MNDFGASGPTEILQYAIDAVNDIGESTLTPEKWEKFVHCMSLMDAALDKGDLAEIQRCRQVIEALQPLQHNETEALPEVQKTRQSAWIRGHSEHLTRRLEQAKAGKTPPSAGPRR